MLLKNDFEFRGSQFKTSKKGNQNLFISLEDENGESFTLWADNKVNVNSLEKGDSVNVTFDFDTRYSSIKIVGIEAY